MGRGSAAPGGRQPEDYAVVGVNIAITLIDNSTSAGKQFTLVSSTPPKPASQAASGDVIKSDDELEKLRSNLLHAYDKPKPLARRIIEAVKVRAPTNTWDQETKKKEHAA